MLSLLTQVGGLIYLMVYPFFSILKKKISGKSRQRLAKGSLFLSVYLTFTFFIIPPIAKHFGRVPIPYFHEQLKPLNYLTCVLNRHYVTPTLLNLLSETSEEINAIFPNTTIAYMDVNFPFINGFPLIPHLSHNDGKKVDLTFLYRKMNSQEAVNRRAKSWIGYGGSEKPLEGEENMPELCRKKGYWQYNLLTQLTPKLLPSRLEVDQKRMQSWVRILNNHPKTGKIFIEPYLKNRWELNSYKKIRFHGCHAVRHDDHLHLQL